jgi:hypothetical protein
MKMIPNMHAIFTTTIFMCLILGKTRGDLERIGVKISHGVYLKELENTIVFQSSLPIIFTAPMPKTSLVDPISLEETCTGNITFCNSTTLTDALDIMHKLDSEAMKYQEAVMNQIKVQESFMENDNSRQRRDLVDPIRTTISNVASWCCGVATTRQFSKLFTNQQEIKKAINTISSSVHEEHENYVKISDNFKTMADTMNTNFDNFALQMKLYRQLITDSDLQTSVMKKFVLNSITHLYARNYEFTRQNLRASILADCRNFIIPAAVISQDMLQHELTLINEKLATKQWTLAIGLSSITNYFQLQIAECLMSQDTILIKLKIPIKQIGPNYRLYKFLSIPQKHKDNLTCTLLMDNVLLGISHDNKKVIPFNR